MSKAIAVKINGISFLAETDNSIEVPADLALTNRNSKTERDSDFEEVIDLTAAEQSFSDVKRLIIECCSSLHEAITEIPNPEKVAIEFGVKLAGETGFPMITKASGEANFKISIEWKGATGSSS